MANEKNFANELNELQSRNLSGCTGETGELKSAPIAAFRADLVIQLAPGRNRFQTRDMSLLNAWRTKCSGL